MEIVALDAPTHLIQAELPPIPARLAEKCSELNDSVGSLPPVALQYAERWLRKGDVYYDSQTYEYRALYRYLGIADSRTGILLLATLPGTAISVLPPKQEWMACDLGKPGTGQAGSGFTVLKEEQRLARKPDGQSRIFQPQGSTEFGERYLFALLNIVGQDYSTVIIDATAHHEYAFHLQIALNKITSPGGYFVWRVSTDFLIQPQNQAHIAHLLQEFDSVCVATLLDHDRFDTHFIIATARRMSPRTAPPDLPEIINRLVDHWVGLARHDYIKQICMAKFFDSIDIRTSAAADKHWDTHAQSYYNTQTVKRDKLIPSVRW